MDTFLGSRRTHTDFVPGQHSTDAVEGCIDKSRKMESITRQGILA
jgi:hypothetical protein